MANRRQFLAASVASSALLTPFAARAASILGGSVDKSLAGFVYDERFEPGPALAQSLDQHAATTYAIRGDVAEIWYDSLLPSLKENARAIGGLTAAGSLFVLARLGHDAGLRLVLHGQHHQAEGHEAEHLTMDAQDLVKREYEVDLASGMPWVSALQSALLGAATSPSTSHVSLTGMGPIGTHRQATMHSWVLVPRTGLLPAHERIGQ